MQELLQWWNLLFLLPLLLAVALLLVGGLGGIGEGDPHADVHTPHVEVTGGETPDTDGDHGSHHPLAEALEWAGVGVVPITLLFAAFLLFFGIVGLAANRFLDVAPHPEGRIWLTLGIATVGGLIGMAGFGAVGRRLLPRHEGPATGNRDLLGRAGRVVYEVTEDTGTVQVRDASGTVHQIAARVPKGHSALVPGQQALIITFETTHGFFIVDDDPTSEPGH